MSTFSQDDFHDYEEVGSGGEGAVFRAKTKIFGNVAVKVFTGKMNLREIEHMQKFSHHPNIIQYFGTVEVGHSFPPRYGYVMKYMSEGSVYDAIHVKKLKYSMEKACSWILQAARGIAYLHDNNIIHRDIKPSNMLFSDSLKTVLISDFGLAKINERHTTTSFGGATLLYRAPEIFQNFTDYSKSSDIFSFAISMWEILTKRVPYAEYPATTDDLVLRIEVLKGTRPSLNDILDSDVSEFLKRAWDSDAKSRPTIEEVVTFFEERQTSENPSEIDSEGEDSDTESETPTPSESRFSNQSSSEPRQGEIDVIGHLPDFYDRIPNETTILILGEMGAGNATFVNGIFNHLKYGTFDEAMKNGMDIIIEERFSTIDEHGNEITMRCEPRLNGNSFGSNMDIEDNGLYSKPSSTLHFKTYKFSWGRSNNQKTMKIVYTPEMGACGSKERLNTFSYVQSVVCGLREVNAICVVLNPTETEETANFYVLLQRLLSMLTVSVRKNVFFFFNTTNQSDYDRQGLNQFLYKMKKTEEINIPRNDRTIFSFDNDGFLQFCRNICASRKGVKFPIDNVEVLKEKWTKTLESIFKLHMRMSSVPPIVIGNALSFKNCPDLLCKFTRALLVLAKIKMRNLQVIEDKLREIDDYGQDKQTEEPLLEVEKILLIVYPTPTPLSLSLFCPSISSGEQNIFKKGQLTNCAHCNCSKRSHLSTQYKLIELKTKITHSEAENNTKSPEDKAEITRPFTIRIEKEKTRLNQDIEEIVDSIREFSIFLKDKSIHYEDEEYIQPLKERIIHPDDDPYIEYVDKLLRDVEQDDTLKEMFEQQELHEVLSEIVEDTDSEIEESATTEINEIYYTVENLKTMDNGDILTEILQLEPRVRHMPCLRETVVDLTSI